MQTFSVNMRWQVEQANVPSQAPNPSISRSLFITTSSRLSPSFACNISKRYFTYKHLCYQVRRPIDGLDICQYPDLSFLSLKSLHNSHLDGKLVWVGLEGYGVERFAGENFAGAELTESVETGESSGWEDCSESQQSWCCHYCLFPGLLTYNNLLWSVRWSESKQVSLERAEQRCIIDNNLLASHLTPHTSH